MIHASSDKNHTLSSVCQQLNILEANLISAEQTHSNEISIVTQGDLGKQIPGVDALITAEKGLPLVIRTADCAPILIHDPSKQILALVHAGRKGTELEITYKTIQKLKGTFSSDPKNLTVKIDPCIGKCCYPMDIRKENLKQLLKAGVLEENIAINSACTCCNKEKYYSYRGDGPETSRNFLVAML